MHFCEMHFMYAMMVNSYENLAGPHKIQYIALSGPSLTQRTEFLEEYWA